MEFRSAIVGICALMFFQVSDAAPARFDPCLKNGPSYRVLIDHSARTSWAEEFRSANIKLDVEVPTLSPEDKRWLDTELKAGIRRELLANDSIQGVKYLLKRETQHREQLLSVLSQPAATSLRTQIEYWAMLAASLNDYRFPRLVEAAVDFKIIDKEFLSNPPDMSGSKFLALVCSNQATHILRRIVIPYLNGEIEK